MRKVITLGRNVLACPKHSDLHRGMFVASQFRRMRSRILGISSIVFLLSVTNIGWAQESEPETQEQVTEEIIQEAEVVPPAKESEEPKPEEQGTTLTFQRVITATRVETPIDEVAGSITVIPKKEIEQKQHRNILDALRGTPGLDGVQNGINGGSSSVFIRGTKSEHTLFLIDGVEINDPMTPGRTFNYASLLPTNNIDRIEILRGPQSSLYGSDAIGGVINIITERGEGRPQFYASGEAGSYGTYVERAGLSGGTEKFHYSFGSSRQDSNGISAASKEDGNLEKDGFENTTLSARVGFTPNQILSSDLIVHYIDGRSDIDNAGGPGGDDPNYRYHNKQLVLRKETGLSLFDGRWKQKMGFSLVDHDRYVQNDVDADHPLDLSRQTYKGRLSKWDWQHDVFLGEISTLTFGVEREKETGRSDYYSESMWGPYSSIVNKQKLTQTGYYAQHQLKLGNRFVTTMGMRLNDHSQYGTNTTYHLTSVYMIPETGTRLKATYGTGFKAPTLYQLYSDYGNTTLKPEKSRGLDAGFEQSFWDDRLGFGTTFFFNRIENLIDFDAGTLSYLNASLAKSKGLEFATHFQPMDNLLFRLNYTYTDTEDSTTDDLMLRRPRNKVGMDINYRFLDKGNLNLSIIRSGGRDDMDYSSFPYARVVLNKYTLVSLTASYDVTRHVRLFGRVQNIFDKDYEEVKGFGTAGANAYAGMKILI